jgi:hypothetical protein
MKSLLTAEALPPNPYEPQYVTGPQVLANEGLRRFGNNALNLIPGLFDVGGKALAHTTAGARTLGAAPRLAMTGQNIPDFYNAAAQQELGRGVAGGAQQLPQTSVMEIQSLFGPGTYTDNLNRNFEAQMSQREQFPGWAAGGDVSGDVATLALGRLPWQRGVQRQKFIKDVTQRAAEVVEPTNMSYLMTKLKPSVAREIQDIWKTKLVKNLRRGFLRAGETGIEGAALAVLNENDPVQTAAYAAGAQMLGSSIMAASGTKTGLGLTAAAAIGMTFHQMLKDAMPGGKDYILESIETSYQHLTALLIAGGLVTLAGAGRAPARLQANMPELADALTSVPRGAVLSWISEMNDPRNDTETMELVYGKLARDPNYFGPTAARRLDRAMRNENLSPAKTVEQLMQNKRFQRQVDDLYEQKRAAVQTSQQPQPQAPQQPQQAPQQPQQAPAPTSAPQGIPPGANPMGVPEDLIMGAVGRAEQVPQGQAMQNAEMAMSQQVADRILRSLDANPGKIPKEKEAQIRRLLADRNAVTPQTLEEINALLRSD